MSEHPPYEVLAEALEAWHQAQASKAEDLFRRGIDAYKRYEPEGLDFAIGRYGAFLLSQGRLTEAEGVLRQAIQERTDIPAVWGDYMRIQFKLRDLEALVSSARNMAQCVSGVDDASESLLRYARKAQREADIDFAEALARRVAGDNTLATLRESRWAAIGDLAEIIQSRGRKDEAFHLWDSAFADGSSDPGTADRLSLHLEREKRHEKAADVIHQALERGLPANVEERLRKRLLKCESKSAKASGPIKKADVPAFSVRKGESEVTLAYQIRVSPLAKRFELNGEVMRCLSTTKGRSTITELNAVSGIELRRQTQLPEFKEAKFSEDGWGLGWWRDAPIGRGLTSLSFLDQTLEVAGEATIPDAVSDVAFAKGLAFVGCRDGSLYAFDELGSLRWTWDTPVVELPPEGVQDLEDRFDGDLLETQFRPCPFYVSAASSYLATSSSNNVWALSLTGETLWHSQIPSEIEMKKSISIPLPTPPVDFGENVQNLDISYELRGLVPNVTFLRCRTDEVVVASIQGAVYILDRRAGRVERKWNVGKTYTKVGLGQDGSPRLAYCDQRISLLWGRAILASFVSPEFPNGLEVFEEDIVLWRDRRVLLLDRAGHVLWEAEFSKPIKKAVVLKAHLLVGAGVLASFSRGYRSG